MICLKITISTIFQIDCKLSQNNFSDMFGFMEQSKAAKAAKRGMIQDTAVGAKEIMAVKHRGNYDYEMS